jgi:hypothetical protein
MQPLHRPALDPVRDGSTTEPSLQQLGEGNDVVLPASDRRDSALDDLHYSSRCPSHARRDDLAMPQLRNPSRSVGSGDRDELRR